MAQRELAVGRNLEDARHVATLGWHWFSAVAEAEPEGAVAPSVAAAREAPRVPQPDTFDLLVIGRTRAALAAACEAARCGGRVALAWPTANTDLDLSDVPRGLRALFELARQRRPVDSDRSESSDRRHGAAHDDRLVMALELARRAAQPPDSETAVAALRAAGVECLGGPAAREDARRWRIGERTVLADRVVTLPDPAPVACDVAGLAEVGYRGPDAWLDVPPDTRRVAVLGGGEWGCAWAQALARFGCQVHLVEQRALVLDGWPLDVRRALERQLTSEGVHLHMASRVDRAEARGGARVVVLRGPGGLQKLLVDEVHVAPEPHGPAAAPALHAWPGPDEAAGQRAARQAVWPRGLLVGAAEATAHVATDPAAVQVGATPATARWTAQWPVETYRVLLPATNGLDEPAGEPGLALVYVRSGLGWIVGATLVDRDAAALADALAVAIAARTTPARLAAIADPGSRLAALGRAVRAARGPEWSERLRDGTVRGWLAVRRWWLRRRGG